MSTNSCIYSGEIRHRRLTPVEHAFRYRLFLLYVDLDELPNLFRRHWLWSAHFPNVAWFRRRDHFGSCEQPLSESVRELVEDRLGWRPDGPIRLLTHFRYFGFLMNPVSFFYCFDRTGERVQAVVAEVTNTPWNETHCYVLDARHFEPLVSNSPQIESEFTTRNSKELHVSPFLGMEFEYQWQLSIPGDRLRVHIENCNSSKRPFAAWLILRRRPLNSVQLAWMLIRFPLMTVQVAAAIYWQAVRLWLKRIPFVPHPSKHLNNDIAVPKSSPSDDAWMMGKYPQEELP